MISLVYVCDKGSAWATAAFTQKSSGASLNFSTSIIPGLGPSAQLQGSWSNSSASWVTPNWGPQSGSPTPRSSPSLSGHSFDTTCAHTFFFRSFRIQKRSMPFIGLKLRAQAGPHDLGGFHRDSGNSTAVMVGARSSSSRNENVGVVRTSLPFSSSISNDYAAGLGIHHYRKWCRRRFGNVDHRIGRKSVAHTICREFIHWTLYLIL
jgi:hypothetical protein